MPRPALKRRPCTLSLDAAAAELHLREALADARAVADALWRAQVKAKALELELAALRRVAGEAERWLAAADPADAGALRAALAGWRTGGGL